FQLSLNLVVPPGAPTLAPAGTAPGSVSLSWTAPASDGGSSVTGYNVYRGTSAGNETLLDAVGNVTSYTDPTVSGGGTYFYEVSALNEAGEGAPSNERSATVPAATAPGAPSLDLASGAQSSVVLGWSPRSTGGSPITGYKVYRGTSAGGE